MSDPANQTVSDPKPDNIEDSHQTTILLNEGTKPAAPAIPPENKPADATNTIVEFELTGDVGLDMALAFIGKAGISESHPAMVAATNGDFTILKATLAAKGVQGWEQFVALGEAAYTRRAAEAAKTQEAVKAAVYKEAGGKDEWEAVQKWASANATAEEKAEINALLNKGGLAAKGAVKYLVDAYSRANNVEVNPRDPLASASRGGVPATDSGPLSPRQYADAVQQLNVKLRGNLDGSKEYGQLQRRRAAYRG